MTDPNAAGQTYSLTVITPVVPGQEERLRSCLAHFGPGEHSPLAVLSTLHFARWVVFTFPVRGSKREEPRAGSVSDTGRAQLLFDACFDGSLEAFLDAMRTMLGSEADAVWQHCEGYPGSSEPAAFAGYIRRHQMNASLVLAAYPDATVQDVRASLALRRRIIDFAVAAQEMDGPALLRGFREAFELERTAALDAPRI